MMWGVCVCVWGGGGGGRQEGGGRNQLVSFFPHPSLFLCSDNKTYLISINLFYDLPPFISCN